MGGSSLKGKAAVSAAAVCCLSTYRLKIQHPVDLVAFQLLAYEIIFHKITVAVFFFHQAVCGVSNLLCPEKCSSSARENISTDWLRYEPPRTTDLWRIINFTELLTPYLAMGFSYFHSYVTA